MIKRYNVDINSIFYKSLMLDLFEPGEYGFKLNGITFEQNKELFPIDKIKYTKKEMIFPSRLSVVYLDDEQKIKSLVILSSKGLYYLFKVDHQNEFQLNINQKYISKDLSSLTDDYEKHLKVKGKNLFDGVGDFSLIQDVDYFENRFSLDIKKQNKKESNIYRLTFKSTNKFTTDFIDLVDKKEIVITNGNKIDSKVLTLLSMQKNRDDRQDSLLINSETKDIVYFAYTYKSNLVNHYYLFKNLGNNQFSFIFETIFFNEIFASDELKGITYKNASALSIKSFEKKNYHNFFTEFIDFQEEEEFDIEVQNKLPVEEVKEIIRIDKAKLIKGVLEIVKQRNYTLDIGITYHGKTRLIERIGEMKDEEMLALVKVAYELGKNSVHFLESDQLMFKFLQFHQNKKQGKTLRMYENILFFFSMKPPHELVTCFPFQKSFELYTKK